MLKKCYITNLFVNLILAISLILLVVLGQSSTVNFIGNILKIFVILNLILLIFMFKNENYS